MLFHLKIALFLREAALLHTNFNYNFFICKTHLRVFSTKIVKIYEVLRDVPYQPNISKCMANIKLK